MSALHNTPLVPGASRDVRNCTALSYLTKPLADQMARAFEAE